ncbi:MAG: tetratricopeptide repeat protein [Chloroflexota bacterium]|nr:tetratricopeptide repeat protein [Chloroflexota bacterium]
MTQNPVDTVSALIEESYALERTGQIGPALRRARKALEEAHVSGADEEVAAALTGVAHCQHHLGHYEQACALAEQALAHTSPDSRARVDALRILGSCAHESGDLTTAEQFFHCAIDIARELGHYHALQSCLHSLAACVYIPRGQFELAQAADEESLRLALELDMSEVVWFPLATMGWVYWVTGQRKRALAVTEEMRGFVQSGSMAEGYYYCLRADLAQDGENPESALPLYTRARAIAEVIGDPGLNAELRVGLSRYHRKTGNAPAAYNWADDALTIAQRSGCRDLQGWALIERGRAAWEIGDLTQAESDLVTAIGVLTSMQAHYDLARANFLLAALYQQQGRPEAESIWLEAVAPIVNGGYAFLLEREQTLAFPLLAHYLNSDDPHVATLSIRLLDHLMCVPPPPLHVYALGRFHVRQGRRAIPDQTWRQRRAGELFRLLLVSFNRTVLRDQVMHALWPDKSPRSAQSLFHQATSSLRRALEPDLPDKFPSRYLTVDGGRVTLQLPEDSWVDFEALEKHIGNQDWQAALECYRGDLFPGDLYADWPVARRERLKQHVIRAALAIAKDALPEHPDKALNASRRVLALEPWQEEAVLLGMKACVAQNDRAGAIRLYQELERSLREELAIMPQKGVQDYYRSVVST